MGGFASAEREALRPIMKQTSQLYWYNNQYEGGVADKNTFCTGAVAEQQIIPAMEYMVANFGKKFYIPAADYNFGQLSAMWSRAFAPVIGAEVVGEEFIPLSVSEFSSTISRIQKANPDWLMMYITGQNHSNYYPQANATGVRYPMGSSINMAQGYEHRRFAAPALAGMHVAVNYMEEIPTARNKAFVKRWRTMFPDEAYISQQAQNAYIATHLYAVAARIAGTTDQPAVSEALESGPHHQLRAGVAQHRALVDPAARREPGPHAGVQAVHAGGGPLLQEEPKPVVQYGMRLNGSVKGPPHPNPFPPAGGGRGS
jgi:branched-chain amino acid transport system substrate-binding protein